MKSSFMVLASKPAALSLVALILTNPASATERQALYGHVPEAISRLGLQPTGRLPATNRLNLAIGLPLRNTNELNQLLHDLYDPASPQFRRYLSPQQFTERFGPTKEDYEAVMDFSRRHGLRVTGTHPNRVLLDVLGAVPDIERALHITMSSYRHPKGARTFYAPDIEPSPELSVPILRISGLDNYAPPRPCSLAAPLGSLDALGTASGSGPNGNYMSKDLRTAYVPGVSLTGTGQAVGLFQMVGYDPHDVQAYETLAGIPSVTLSNVLVDGVEIPPGLGSDEVNLDIDVAIAMAPGLSQVIVYEGLNSPDDVLNRMATDNLAKQLSCSWFWGPTFDPLAHQAFLQMAAQGQSMFVASGDAGAWVSDASAPAPSDDPDVTLVGGTTLTMSANGGAYVSEVVWNDGQSSSGGGVSVQYPIPPWQQGLNMTANGGSRTMRNMPDVAMPAPNVQIWYNGAPSRGGGTSAAAPLWAGFTALVNQAALANGGAPVGFLNPAVYALGQSAAYPRLFHDVVSGNNQNEASPSLFQAMAGYDLCTGWGSPAGNSLIHALAVPGTLLIVPSSALLFTGPVGGPFQPISGTCNLTNQGATLNWAGATDASWLALSPASGTLSAGAATNVTVQLNAQAGTLPAGTYTANLFFTNLSDQVVQARPVVLAIVTPPVVTLEPTNQAAIAGTSVTFSVGTATNALLQYEWLFSNGSYTTNVADGAGISGSSTSTLTISNVSPSDAGAYSVVVSNAAGSVSSTAASLSLVSSPPVILVQPTNQMALPGGLVTLSVMAVGDQPVSYWWQMNGSNLADGGAISGSATSLLTISNASLTNAGSYAVVITNSLGSITSATAVVTVAVVSAPGVALDTLYSFRADNALGAYPYGGLVQAKDGNLYGTALQGGFSGLGTVFRITTDGGATLVHSFGGSEGAFPYGGLVQGKNGNLYGTTIRGFPSGSVYWGTVFQTTTAGSAAAIGDFAEGQFNAVGNFPLAGLIQGEDGNFYGTASQGGLSAYGALYRITPSGSMTTLAPLNGADGAVPSSTLLQAADGAFYGTAQNGGTNGGWGTVFRVTPAGLVTTLISFANTNGAQPTAGLVQDADGSIYGTTYAGGSVGAGTVFKLAPDGTFSGLYSFSGGSDGAHPYGGLLLASDGNLYGTTESGGSYGHGTIFRLAPTGGLVSIGQFDGYQGGHPEGTLLEVKDGRLYGTTRDGGAAGKGAIFRLSLDGGLQITRQPQTQAAFAGNSILFSVATSGALPTSYQWVRSGTNLVDGGYVLGSSSRVLTVSNVSLADASSYSVIVSNVYGAVTSAPASLQVLNSAPQILSGPMSQTVLAGTTVTLMAEADGAAPLYYQWQENGNNLVDGGNISGSTTATLTLTAVAATNSGTYSLLVSNAIGAVPSPNAVLTVVPVHSPAVALTTLHAFSPADDGGDAGNGSVFKLYRGGGFSLLGSFGVGNGLSGVYPLGGVIQGKDGNFYGAAFEGGMGGAGPANGSGTLFKVTPGGILTPFHTFGTYVNGNNGSGPAASLILGNDGFFYGTTEFGGNPTNITAVNGITEGGYGAIFKISTNGVLTTLVALSSTNGAFPVAPLIQANDGSFYGTTSGGGSNGFGTVFSLTTNGALRTLASFDYTEGAYPSNGLVQTSDGAFYGTAARGGTNGGWGTVFRVRADGTLTSLHSFDYDDGAVPVGGLVQASDGNLYGTTSQGGIGGAGTVFQITTNGQLTTLVWFNGPNGAGPQASLIQAQDGYLYGTTEFGGTAYNGAPGTGDGLVFRLILPLFLSQSITQGVATVGQPYAASLANNAITPPGDPLTFAKVSGPGWLNVAPNGTLAGTPSLSDIGPNSFTVSLSDVNGWSSTAVLRIAVVPAPLLASLVLSQGANLVLSWTGGQPPYQVQMTTNLANPVWQTIAGPTTNTMLALVPTNAVAFFRVQGP